MNKPIRLRLTLIAALLSFTFAGCSGSTKPEGMPDLQPLTLSVTQGGAPLEGASVQLIAKDKANSRWSGGGVTDATGQVSLKTLGEYEGVVPGSYKITFYKELTEGSSSGIGDDPTSTNTGKSFLVIDPKYQAEATTPVEIEVSQGVDTLPAIDVGDPVKVEQKMM